MRVSQRNLPDAAAMKARDKGAGLPKAGKKKAKKKTGKFKTAMGRASEVQKSLKENQLNAPPDNFGADHGEAVAIGREIQQNARRSQPGKAQAIIKNRRV